MQRSTTRLVAFFSLVIFCARGATAESVLAPDYFHVGETGAAVVLSPRSVPYSLRLETLTPCSSAPCTEPVTASAQGSAGAAVLEIPVEIPSVLPEGSYNLTVVSGEGQDAARIYSQSVEVVGNKRFLFLETDKPVYKPGSTIRIRSVCLLSSLHTCGEQDSAMRFVLKNPDGAKIRAVEGEQVGATGIFEASLVVDSRAPLGEYTVVAEGAELEAEISVSLDEYVLPKFETSLAVDQEYVYPSTKALTGTVSATYSYGKGVEGTASLRLRKQLPWHCDKPSPAEPVPLEEGGRASSGFVPPRPPGSCDREVLVQEDVRLVGGSYSFELGIPPGLDTWSQLELEAEITEAATGTTVNSTQTIQLRGEPYVSVELNGPEIFYPGLYMDFDIISEMSDGRPRNGTYEVSIEFNSYVPSDFEKPPELDLPRRLITRTVEVVDGKGRLSIQAPKQPDCCLEAVAKNTSEFDWSQTACCWGTITPEIVEVSADDASDRNRRPNTGRCMEPAFPPRAFYLSVEADASSFADKVSVSVQATGDVSSRDLLFFVTADGLYLKSSAVEWDSLSYDPDSDVSSGTFSFQKSMQMIPSAHVVVAHVERDGSMTVGEGAVTLNSPEDLALLRSRPVSLGSALPANRDYYLPGEKVKVDVDAEPDSVVFIGGVDRAVSFLSNEDTRVSPARLLDAVKGMMRGSGSDTPPPFPPIPGPPCDVFRGLAAAGLNFGASEDHPVICPRLVFSGSSRETGPTCYPPYRFDNWGMFPAMAAVPEMADGAVAFKSPMNSAARADPEKPKTKVQVRSKFPETWIWRSVTVGANGTASFVKDAPDSITTWELSAFSVSGTAGVGLGAGPVDLRVFKPLFVDIKLPYKVVRGEVLEVVASVFNYEAEAREVELRLTAPANQTGVTIPAGEQSRTLSVGANSAESFRVNLRFSELGDVQLRLDGTSTSSSDSVVRSLKVVPEGVRKESSLNIMLQPPEGGVQEEEIPVQVDDVLSLVPGSEYATLTVAGELLGPSLEGLGSLVQLPMGCGEQNMLLMAPTVYVLRYLDARGEARPALREKALGFIEVGYSRELEYKHPDGSFSAFGPRDESGSTWLTAFVLKVFSQAKGAGLLEPSPEILESAAMWLAGTQDPSTGKFESRGRVIHSDMVGGVDDDSASVSLTAFVTSALLEAHAAEALSERAADALSKALEYLMGASASKNYAKVLVAHTLAVAEVRAAAGLPAPPGLADAAAEAYAIMQSAAVSEGSTKHWAPVASEPKEEEGVVGLQCRNCYPARASGPEVEMTGYALSTIILREGSGDALLEAFPVAKWLLAERAPSGGWRSTQDTTVALEGLSAYAAKAAEDPPELRITVRHSGAGGAPRRLLSQAERLFVVDASNYDILQTMEVPVGGNLSVAVEGTGKAIMTLGVVWHMKAKETEPTFLVQSSGMQTSETSVVQKMSIQRMSGSDQGMVIADVQVFTGMVPRPESLRALGEDKLVCHGALKRVDYADDRLSFYIDRLAAGDGPCDIELELEKEMMVENMQPSSVEVYEYYNPQKVGTAETSPIFEMSQFAETPEAGEDSGAVFGRVNLMCLRALWANFVLFLLYIAHD